MRRVLVFGGNVFIGKAIATKFLENGDEVYVLNRGNAPAPNRAILLIADRNDKDKLEKVLKGKEFDIIMDGSAYTPLQTRLAIEVLEKTYTHYIHLSSATVYKEENTQPYKEESVRGKAKSWGEYSLNKYECEQILIDEYNKNKLPISIIRPFYVYGPKNNLDREIFIFSRLLQNKPIIVPGMGKCKLQFGHIDDLCDAILEISNTGKSIGQAYNISGKEHVTFEEWIELCAEAIGIQANMIFVDTKQIKHKAREWFPFRDIDMVGDCTKIEKELKILPKYTLLEGLRQTLKHYTKEELISASVVKPLEIEIFKMFNK